MLQFAWVINMNIKIGCCTGIRAMNGAAEIENLSILAAAGFEYVELPVASVAGLTNGEYLWLSEVLKESGLRCEAGNALFTGDFRLTGETTSEVDEYCNKAFSNMAGLGAEAIVFGAGRARNVPDGFPREKAREQLVQLLRRLGGIAANYGITVCLEPLNKSESNIVNSLTEGIDMIAEANTPGIAILADYYHMALEGEGIQGIISALERAKSVRLFHTHIANPDGRVFPDASDKDDYSEFAKLLKFGKPKRISVEATVEDVEKEAAEAVRVLKGLF